MLRLIKSDNHLTLVFVETKVVIYHLITYAKQHHMYGAVPPSICTLIPLCSVYIYLFASRIQITSVLTHTTYRTYLYLFVYLDSIILFYIIHSLIYRPSFMIQRRGDINLLCKLVSDSLFPTGVLFYSIHLTVFSSLFHFICLLSIFFCAISSLVVK